MQLFRTDPTLYCDVYVYLDSIGDLESNSAFCRIGSLVKIRKNVDCRGHHNPVVNVDNDNNCIWDHTV